MGRWAAVPGAHLIVPVPEEGRVQTLGHFRRELVAVEVQAAIGDAAAGHIVLTSDSGALVAWPSGAVYPCQWIAPCSLGAPISRPYLA